MWFLILGHLLGDFAFQTDAMAREKGRNPRVLLTHTAIYVATVGSVYLAGLWLTGKDFTSPGLLAILLGAIFVFHYLQDLLKVRRFNGSRQAYYLDQALHIIQLYILRLWLG